MSQTITNAFVIQWDTTIRQQAQQMDSRFASAVTDRGNITGESFTANRLAPLEDMPANNVRHGDTVWSEANHSTRIALMQDFYQALPVDDPRRRRPDITRARELLGWSPRTGLDQGLKATIAWFAGDGRPGPAAPAREAVLESAARL